MGSKKLLFVFTLLFFTIVQSNIFSQAQQSFCRTGINIPIINLSTLRDSVLVNLGAGCIVTDVNFKILNITHTWDSDMLMYLQKGNAGSQIIRNVGGSGDNFTNTILDDSAAIPILSGTAPFTGTYRPSNPLTPFIGIPTDGYWRYLINDTAGGDDGSLTGWCVIITFTCPTGGIQTVEIPNTYMLYQNYPNPFNPVTKIKYGVPQNGYVKITVYNELGELVKIVDEGYKEANTYEAVFDATNLPNGVYYYKLEASTVSGQGFTDTKKMVIIK
ncbi:MAG: T9SS type A sorting domain-containing protein [Ignavibacteria bacterium]